MNDWLESGARVRNPCLLLSLAAFLLAGPIAGAQTVSTEPAHRAFEQGLFRAEAAYSGDRIAKYIGKDCASTIVFGNSRLSIDWSQVTGARVDGTWHLRLIGNFDDSKGVRSQDVALLGNHELSKDFLPAANWLAKRCRLRSSIS
jgi:hypothetical protein